MLTEYFMHNMYLLFVKKMTDIELNDNSNKIIIIIIRKEMKYQSLARTHTFIPLAFETLGPINSKGITFFNELGRRLSACSGDSRETSYLYQRLSIAIQRFNGICFHGSFSQRTDTDTDS